MRGVCEMCGAEDQELRILFVADFAGWACETCSEQLRECQVRRYSGGEETEPGE